MQGKFPNHTHIPSLGVTTIVSVLDHVVSIINHSANNSLTYTQRFLKSLILCSLSDTLEMADDMAIDIPHIWLYLAELLSPLLKEGGIPMGELFR